MRYAILEDEEKGEALLVDQQSLWVMFRVTLGVFRLKREYYDEQLQAWNHPYVEIPAGDPSRPRSHFS